MTRSSKTSLDSQNVKQKYIVITFKWGPHQDLKNGSLFCDAFLDVMFSRNLLLVLYEAV